MINKSVPPDEALDADISILGKKGRGKTYAAKGIVERLLQMKRRVLVLIPLSTWWGPRLSADGKRERFPVVVFGGPYADIPINGKSGAALARALVAEPINAVVDLGLMRKAEQARLVADLLDELFTRNRSQLTIVLEEADAFAPQQPMNDMIRVLSEVDRIARRGLKPVRARRAPARGSRSRCWAVDASTIVAARSELAQLNVTGEAVIRGTRDARIRVDRGSVVDQKSALGTTTVLLNTARGMPDTGYRGRESR